MPYEGLPEVGSPEVSIKDLTILQEADIIGMLSVSVVKWI